MKKVTINKDGSPRKTGSGRKKGAKSFVSIRVSDLEQFCGQNTLIPVSRVWLEQMGASVSESTPTPVKQEVAESNEKISFTLHQ
jgi:hypothetical protein